MKKLSTILISTLLCVPLFAQKEAHINWLSFEALEDSLAVAPRKVFIDFYTDWCTYCRKMDKEVFTDPKVIEVLNEDFYAVRFDAETDSSVVFSSQELVNDQIGQSRNPLHQLAQLLATRQGKFVAPTMVLLDKDFRVTSRYFEYLNRKRLLKALR